MPQVAPAKLIECKRDRQLDHKMDCNPLSHRPMTSSERRGFEYALSLVQHWASIVDTGAEKLDPRQKVTLSVQEFARDRSNFCRDFAAAIQIGVL